MSRLSARFTAITLYSHRNAFLGNLVQHFDTALMWSIFASDCIHPKGAPNKQGLWTTHVLYVFKSLFCLSASVCETSNLFVWTHSWRDVRTVLTETNREASAHIVHSAHILLIQFWEIALPQKRLSLFCHSASQVTFTANNLTG